VSAPRAFLRVRVTPRASASRVAPDARGGLRVHLTAPPVEGAANAALIRLLADWLDLPKRSFEVTRGARSRDKVICIHDCSPAQLESRLGAALVSGVDKGPRHG